MKTIGLLGGMSWESTLTYYQIINMVTAQTLGGLHSARCLLYSVDFDEIERCQQAGDWDRSARILADAAQALERGGADFLVICGETPTIVEVVEEEQLEKKRSCSERLELSRRYWKEMGMPNWKVVVMKRGETAW